MNVCMVGAIGHNGYVIDGVRARPGTVVSAYAPGPHEDDMSSLARHFDRVGLSPKSYPDYRSMLDSEKPDIVTIACHYSDHADVAMDVIRRGHAAFVEKPLSTTEEKFAELSKVYKEHSVALSCMFGLRYEPAFMTAWQLVSHGAIGRVRLMTAQKSYRLGNRPDWFGDRTLYGGTIPWIGSHAIDWVRWFSGETFESVFAAHSTRDNRGNNELEVSALCNFTMTNEVFAGINIDYLRPTTAPTHGDDRIRIAGSDGVLEIRNEKLHIIDGDGARELPLDEKREIFGEFIDQVKGEGMCSVTAEDAFAVTWASLLARRSADEGKLVRF